ncbi:MAG TPA: penicillin-binding protein 1A [bacterium]|nr:penicillin-binding protein 1A [bacterium]
MTRSRMDLPHIRETLRTNRAVRIGVVVGLCLLLLGTMTTGAAIGMVVSFNRRLPDVAALYAPPAEASRIFARDGQLVASLFQENRAIVPIDRIPAVLQQAVLAIEDERFHQHHGVDFRGTMRAMWRNLLARDLVEGGSTITQQLARTVFLSPERAFSRKLAEILMAVEIERRFTKAEILERYLNEVYFGHGAYGVGMAARVFFDRPVEELTLAQSAILASLIRAPSIYSPYRNLPRVQERQRLVLRRMTDVGFVTRRAAAEAEAEPLTFVQERNLGLVGVRAPYFVSYILPMLLERYGEEAVYRGGLRIHTTLDLDLQAAAEAAVRREIDAAKAGGLNVTQAALVAIEPSTGAIRAMIGGYDFASSQFNRAWQARRQPGSSFKPFVYITAIASGMSPSKIIMDEPIEYETPQGLWQPQNYGEEFSGPVRLRQAVERSINIPAIRTLEEVGVTRVITFAQRMGITSPLRPDLSLALGSSEVTLLELTSAYGVFAALGLRAEPMAIVRVEDRTGKRLDEAVPQRTVVFSPENAYVMTDILKGVVQRGTGRGADLGRPIAGKTGTTDDYRNAWFLGYAPELVAGVWVGNDDNSPTERVVGAGVPTRIWRSFMETALASVPETDWMVPERAVVVTTCGTSGLLATANCDDPRREAFIRGTEPTEYLVQESPEVRVHRQWNPPAAPAQAGQNDPATGNGDGTGGGEGTAGVGDPGGQRFALALSAPTEGAAVSPPFVIEGTTVPGAKVEIAISVESPDGTVQRSTTFAGAMRDGRFRHTYWQSAPPGARLTITVTAHVRGGDPETATVQVQTPMPTDDGAPRP